MSPKIRGGELDINTYLILLPEFNKKEDKMRVAIALTAISLFLSACAPAPIQFDPGLEYAYYEAFRSMPPEAFVQAVMSQLTALKKNNPGAAHSIQFWIDEANTYAWHVRIEFGQYAKSIGQTPSDPELGEVSTVARAFALARIYMKLKLADWKTATSIIGVLTSLNSPVLLMPNPALVCSTSPLLAVRMYFCGLKDGGITTFE